MEYFFILGNNPTLSAAEITAVFGENNNFSLFNNVLIMETEEEFNAEQMIKKLGGTIKIGIIKSKAGDSEKEIIEEVKGILRPGEGKFKFGISYYGNKKYNIKPLAMEIKKYLREKDISCRWVVSREATLSSVVVEQNKLCDKGIEIILIKKENWILIGHTLAVQPFKELSFRDYGRPARDDRSGMLPPKLAQIMINFAGAGTRHGVGTGTRHGAFLQDPFCGSGTILTEAMLMGYNNIIGSDISKKAIDDTNDNIKWIRKNFECRISNVELFNKGATELSKFIKPNSIDAIITEPYLGPQRGRIDIKKIKKELEELYSKSLSEFYKILKDNVRVVMVWPVFLATRDSRLATQDFITPNLNGFKIINPIQESLRDNKIIKLTNRNTIIYGREGQKIWREIVVLEKI